MVFGTKFHNGTLIGASGFYQPRPGGASRPRGTGEPFKVRFWGGGVYMGGCRNYGPFFGVLNIMRHLVFRGPTRKHNFDNHPYEGGIGG